MSTLGEDDQVPDTDDSAKPVDDILLNAIANAYYARAFGAPDARRQQGQSAYTIATAVAAGLLAGGALAGLQDQSLAFRAIGLIAVLFWIAATALFVRSVASKYDDPRKGESARDRTEWVKHVVGRSLEERDQVDRRQAVALGAVIAALAMTLAVLAWAIILPHSNTRQASIFLDLAGVRATQTLCGTASPVLKRGSMSRVSRMTNSRSSCLPNAAMENRRPCGSRRAT